MIEADKERKKLKQLAKDAAYATGTRMPPAHSSKIYYTHWLVEDLTYQSEDLLNTLVLQRTQQYLPSQMQLRP